MARGDSVLLAALVVDSVGNGMFLPLSLLFFARLTDVPLSLIGLAGVLTLPVPLPLVVGAQLAQGRCCGSWWGASRTASSGRDPRSPARVSDLGPAT